MTLTQDQVWARLMFGSIFPLGRTVADRAREAMLIAANCNREPEEIARIQREIARIAAS